MNRMVYSSPVEVGATLGGFSRRPLHFTYEYVTLLLMLIRSHIKEYDTHDDTAHSRETFTLQTM